MPIYEYRCTECDHRLEKLQRMADDPLKDCPECNRPALKKLVSAAAFKLKGSGWYETDFKSKEKSTSETEQPKKESKPEKVSSKSTDKNSSESTKVKTKESAK